MKLYIIRHGETDYNKAMRLQGQTDIPLNDNGRLLAQQTSDEMRELNLDLIYSSPLQRAKETAVILRGTRNIPIIPDDRLKEMTFGKYEGTTPDQRSENLVLFFKSPGKYVSEAGSESIEDLLARAKSFLDDVIMPLSYDNEKKGVLISGHGAMNKALTANLIGRTKEEFWNGTYQKNCALTIFDITERNVTMLEEGITLYNE